MCGYMCVRIYVYVCTYMCVRMYVCVCGCQQAVGSREVFYEPAVPSCLFRFSVQLDFPWFHMPPSNAARFSFLLIHLQGWEASMSGTRIVSWIWHSEKSVQAAWKKKKSKLYIQNCAGLVKKKNVWNEVNISLHRVSPHTFLKICMSQWRKTCITPEALRWVTVDHWPATVIQWEVSQQKVRFQIILYTYSQAKPVVMVQNLLSRCCCVFLQSPMTQIRIHTHLLAYTFLRNLITFWLSYFPRSGLQRRPTKTTWRSRLATIQICLINISTHIWLYILKQKHNTCN